MKKRVIAFAVVSILLLLALLLPYNTTSNGYEHKGLPFSYYQIWYTNGLCIGINGASVADGYDLSHGCDYIRFPYNYAHLAEDLAIVGVVSVAFLYILFRHSDKLRNKAIYGLVGASIAADTLFWFSSKNSSLFTDTSIGLGSGLETRNINYALVLLLVITLAFLIAVIVYLIRSVFKHLSGAELIKRMVPCLIAIAIFFGYCWLIIAGES